MELPELQDCVLDMDVALEIVVKKTKVKRKKKEVKRKKKKLEIVVRYCVTGDVLLTLKPPQNLIQIAKQAAFALKVKEYRHQGRIHR